ncbi:hypothetical protein DRE_04280 [Drechslerella stenobrocha 248]|uniref:RING-type domain-containing protein n=1 Tax=Drechslerella stenobrocha 248 TaxID=1043628 RepID=W7I2G2_9PEZI|nr:hypothetical protein DRE_04280 [Drechslerella stenobrocha 248]
MATSSKTAGPSAGEQYDLCLVTDATGSMMSYLTALQHSLPQILALSKLTSAFTSISVLVYRDYDDANFRQKKYIEFSGWYDVGEAAQNDWRGPRVDLIDFAKRIEVSGGADLPEASKSAVYTLLKNVHPGRRTLCFWYTDAPPHSKTSRSWGGQREKELAELRKDPIGQQCMDWVSCCHMMAKHRVQVMSILSQSIDIHVSWYAMLSAATNGVAVTLDGVNAHNISLVSMDLLMAWLGQAPRGGSVPGVMTVSWSPSLAKKFKAMKDETPKGSCGFLPKHDNDKVLTHKPHTQQYDAMKDVHHKREPVQDFALHFTADPEYQKTVYETLETIIEFDVATISLNPVFGELWRVVCAERGSNDRERVVNAFADAVGNMAPGSIKDGMKGWLEESYNQTKEIERIIAEVPSQNSYPAICIDPTEAGVGAVHWVRKDLLEIARSCHHTVLKRLGNVLTKLVFIESKEECPEHLKDDNIVEKLPFALAVVLESFVASGAPWNAPFRPCWRTIGVRIPGLQEAARSTLVVFRGKWADIEVGENWSLECMRLLLYCDEKDRRTGKDGLLTDFERKLFTTLNGYKLAELNLDTELNARIPFTPEKTQGWIGPTVKCIKCKYDRSVTIMAKNSTCGICAFTDWKTEEAKTQAQTIRAETEQQEKTLKNWVECSNPECRCGYIVYDIEALNVKPKCHYCRDPNSRVKAPFVSCKRCTNRVIWPLQYRTKAAEDFLCTFCDEGRLQTIILQPTSARELNKENGSAWILSEAGSRIGFTSRTVYANVKMQGMETIHSAITLFPTDPQRLSLRLRHKAIQNVADLLAEYQRWISPSRCVWPPRLPPIRGWYGQNAPGKVVNLNSLQCPFCRRAPAPKMLRGYGLNVATLAGVQAAVQQRGRWIFGWCIDCDTAKEYIERVCTAGGQPIELENFVCEPCTAKKDTQPKPKQCPSCTVMTLKTAGCNHITCPCGAHWCYICGEKFDPTTIYPHLSSAHGGYFVPGDELEDDDDDDYY